MVLADALLEKFGGDSVLQTRRSIEAYLAHLDERGLTPAGDLATQSSEG